MVPPMVLILTQSHSVPFCVCPLHCTPCPQIDPASLYLPVACASPVPTSSVGMVGPGENGHHSVALLPDIEDIPTLTGSNLLGLRRLGVAESSAQGLDGPVGYASNIGRQVRCVVRRL